MSYSELYISDGFEEEEETYSIREKAVQLGFDPVSEIPRPYALLQITEGYDIYYRLMLSAHIKYPVEDKPALVVFSFRANKFEEDWEYRLEEISAELYFINGDKRERVAEKRFGGTADFRTKDEMVSQVIAETSLRKILDPTTAKKGSVESDFGDKTPPKRRSVRR